MKEVNEKYLKEIYLNILKAIIVIVYFFILNMAYENVKSEYLELGIKIFTMLFLFISIYIFEKAYKKDDGNLAIQGIEILVLSAYTLTTEHITNKFDFNFKYYSLVASYIYAIYFILKGIVIYTKGRKELAEDFSDIREILKKEEPVKKEATKKVKSKENVNDKKSNQDIDKEKTKKAKKKVSNSEQKNEKPKATRKKVDNTKKEEKPKTTRKKKTDNIKKENHENENIKSEEKTKRKRVKKEVKEND